MRKISFIHNLRKDFYKAIRVLFGKVFLYFCTESFQLGLHAQLVADITVFELTFERFKYFALVG